MDLSRLQFLVFQEYIKNGYKSMWQLEPNETLFEPKRNLQEILDIAELGMILTEISEAIEILRINFGSSKANDLAVFTDKNKIERLGEEIADIIIRTLNFASRKGINIEDEIIWKNKINVKRKTLHNNKV